MRTGATREAVDFEVKITLDRAPATIRPGLSAKATITVARREQALAVPLGAVTVREWPLADADIRRYSGKRAREQEDALRELGFRPRGGEAEAPAWYGRSLARRVQQVRLLGQRGPGGGGHPAAAQSTYLKLIRARILAQRQYPYMARQRRQELCMARMGEARAVLNHYHTTGGRIYNARSD